MLGSYGFLMWAMARLSVRRSFLLNAEFEDHSEHYYAQLVDEHPEWERQAVSDRPCSTRADCLVGRGLSARRTR